MIIVPFHRAASRHTGAALRFLLGNAARLVDPVAVRCLHSLNAARFDPFLLVHRRA
jgi:hypothetical protein